jgi:predicted alpha-1,2-mannosidase
MVQLSPDTRTSLLDWDACSGYHFTDTLLYGFSHTHLSGTGVPDYCDLLLIPFCDNNPTNTYAFQKKNETAQAGYYRVLLDKFQIWAELTTTNRVGVHRYTFPENQQNRKIKIDLNHRDEVVESKVAVIGNNEVAGHRISKAWAKNQHFYFVARFSQPFKNYQTTQKDAHDASCVLDFHASNLPIVVTVGISGTSIEGARKNLEKECNHFNFEQVKNQNQEAWNSLLAKIKVDSPNPNQKTTFYTALYHTQIAPHLWSDVDSLYRGRDQKIHKASQTDQFTVFSLWDTYRACKPLYTLLQPNKTTAFIHTFLRQYQQSGLLPVWELAANETDCMIGNHAIPVIADAYLKGIRNFDAELALQAMMHSANSHRYGLTQYRQIGYIPADMEPESVSKTMEYAFDDWCIAQMAKAMGKNEVHARFLQSSLNYRNLFDPETRFFTGKNNSAWHQPFDPLEVNFNYTEANAWQYRFAAPHDITNLIHLMGGLNSFSHQLDKMFSENTETTGRNQADITGLIGQYAHGNEPSHHIAYLYNFIGEPWKTQQRVRQIMDNLYSHKPNGLSGNEDCGQMSAWLVFSALGFYPVTPASGNYIIGTPWFETCTIELPNQKTLTILAPETSSKNCYIQSATWNNQPLQQSWITHNQLLQGGTLKFIMGDKPSNWGTSSTEIPTQATTPIFLPTPFVKTGKRVFEKKQNVTLDCLDQSASIFYSQNNQPPKRYHQPLTLKKNTSLAFYAQKDTLKTPTQTATFSKLKKNIHIHQYLTHYDNQYTGRGKNGLIDLIRGGADFRSGNWQGYQGQNLDVVINLGKKRPCTSVSTGFLQDENSWIFMPTQLEVLMSNNGKDFVPLGITLNTIDVYQKGTLIQDLQVKFPKIAARYIRVKAENRKICPNQHKGAGYPAWIFADEIIIR